MKSLFTTALLFFVALSLQAQDINAAIEAYNAGATAAQEEHYVTALEKLDQALQLASALGEEGASVVKDCKELIPVLCLRQAKELAAAKDNDNALTTIDKAIQKAKEYGDANGVEKESIELRGKVYMLMANEAFNAKDFTTAITNYNKILADEPENGVAYLRIGMASANSGKNDEAIAALEKAKTLGQGANAAKQLGTIYLKEAVSAQKEKKWQVVYDAAKNAIAQVDNAQGNKLMGLACIELKKFDEALVAWEKVMKDAPTAKDINTTYYRLAVTHEGLGQKGNACSYYKKLMTDPNFKSIAEYKVKTELKCE